MQSDAAMPLQPAEEEEKQSEGHLRVQVVEETKAEALMAAKVDDPILRREQMALDLRKSKKQELLSRRRYPRSGARASCMSPKSSMNSITLLRTSSLGCMR